MKKSGIGRQKTLRTMLATKRNQLSRAISRDLDRGLTEDRLLGVDQVIESGDQASTGVEKDIQIEVLEIKNRTLRAIDGALERLERGRYGQCEECGEEIEQARLEAVPFALYCVSCQREAEKVEKGRRFMQRQFWSGTESFLEAHGGEE
jgi:DnaK suppressor protein